jgi:UDPglucose 6-dehydrogenase
LEESNVGVAGAGYVGLVMGACLVHLGHRVTLMDVDEEWVADLKRRKLPIYEPGLRSSWRKAPAG